MTNNNKQRFTFICLIFLSLGNHAFADELRSANRLLAVTNMERQFEALTQRQTQNIIRTYDSIVATSTSATLPSSIKRLIAACYESAYAWDKFEPGIAQIFADNLTEKEMILLIDFYQSRGLPPGEIESFKATIAKADQIRRLSADYIFSHSVGCVEQDARLILDYLDGTAAD
ncbi:MAG: DUF2059 domain-containing protein [Gammaproteobacteria bacterium]